MRANGRPRTFPDDFFSRVDESDDRSFYAVDQFVTHIDDGAIVVVAEPYDELGLTGEVLDICSSWVSHFAAKPRRLAIVGMNAAELAANQMADEWSVAELNLEPGVPHDDAVFDAVTCCVARS